jgi:NitT/TauT family transport system substrate-binding protein
MKFVDAYREAVDWMYSDPKAMEMYGAKMKIPVEIVKQSADDFQPKSALQSDHMADMDGIVRDAVKLKFLDKPLTKEEIAEFIQIPPRKK